MKFKMIAIDLDGTLLTDDKKISSRFSYTSIINPKHGNTLACQII